LIGGPQSRQLLSVQNKARRVCYKKDGCPIQKYFILIMSMSTVNQKDQLKTKENVFTTEMNWAEDK